MKKRNIHAANLAIFGSPALLLWLFFILEVAGTKFWIFKGGDATILFLTFALLGSIVCAALFFFYSSKQIRLQKNGIVKRGTLAKVGGVSKMGQIPCDISYEHDNQQYTTRVDISEEEISELQNGSQWMMVIDPSDPNKTAGYIDLFCDRKTNVIS